jgi:hypothetical protein
MRVKLVDLTVYKKGRGCDFKAEALVRTQGVRRPRRKNDTSGAQSRAVGGGVLGTKSTMPPGINLRGRREDEYL